MKLGGARLGDTRHVIEFRGGEEEGVVLWREGGGAKETSFACKVIEDCERERGGGGGGRG